MLEPWQQFIVGSLFGWKEKDGFRRFRTAYIEIGKGNGKALALDTLIPTPTGWTTMGAIQVDDQVFDDKGNICNVIATTGIMTNHDCYEMTFSDGGKIIADADHLWKTSALRTGLIPGPRKDTIRKGKSAIRTTRKISQTVSARPNGTNSIHPQPKWNHRVDIAKPLDLPDISLPIAAYTLGAWLGDGDSDAARITGNDPEVLENIQKDGYLIGEKGFKNGTKTFRATIGMLPNDECRRGHPRSDRSPSGSCRSCERERDHLKRNGTPVTPRKHYSLNEILRDNNLLYNKHIPKEYLRAGNEQRLSLLQGITDTDGYISKGGSCEITLCNKTLIKDVMELLRTLGYKPTMTERDAKLNGRIVGRRWRVLFKAYADNPPARLTRKIKRLHEKPKSRPLSHGRMIVGCEKVESVPVRCIAVDSGSQMFLASNEMIPTHNSPIAAGIGLYGLTFDDEPGAEIYSAATTREQAGILFRDAKAFVEGSESLSEFLTVGQHNIAYIEENSFFRPVSSEHRGLDGKRPHMGMIDEVHEHPTDVVVNKIRAGTKGRRQALIFEITNSGYDQQTVCFEHHEYTEKILERILSNDAWFGYITGLDVCKKCEDDGKTIPQDGCPDCDDWRDPKVWPKSNPNLGISIKKKYLQEQVAEAIGMPNKVNIVKRLNFNIWTEGITKWLSADKWNACADRSLKITDFIGQKCYAGFGFGI